MIDPTSSQMDDADRNETELPDLGAYDQADNMDPDPSEDRLALHLIGDNEMPPPIPIVLDGMRKLAASKELIDAQVLYLRVYFKLLQMTLLKSLKAKV